MTRLMLPAILVLGLAACNGDDDDTTDSGAAATYDLTVNGTGFDPHNGQTLEIAVLASDDTVIDTQSTTVADGAFSFSWTDALDEGATYTVHYYADLNESGGCDSPPDDHGWERTIDAVSADVVLDVTHDTNFTDVCASFE